MSNSAIRLLASTWNILGGERNKWLPNIRVIVGADYSRFAASTRQRRDSAGASVNELMENWRAQGLGFDEVLNIELNSYHHSRIEELKALRKNYERRSEERRGGKECVSTCKSGWSAVHKK